MPKNKHDWNTSNIIDDISFEESDSQAFKKLLDKRETSADPGSISGMNSGQVLIGRVVEISKDFVIVDVGLKSEGLIPIEEFLDTKALSLGGDVEVFLDQAEGENGQIVLSHEKARRLRQWEHIVNNCKEGSIIQGKVLRKVKGGLMVDIGMDAFLPGSQIDNKRIKNLDEYINHVYDFKILKINTERKNIVISRRELLEEERHSKKAELLEHIHEGDIRTGVVKNITDFGVFLDLNGIDGLLHITDMTWKRIKHPSEMVKLGDEVEVMILHVDREKGRVALGMKQKEPNPWEEIEARYPVGTKVKGKIVSLVSYGAFLEIEPSVEGLIHVSEMSWTKEIADPSDILKKGDEVEAVVLGVQIDEGKISLGMKQLEANPWDDVESLYPVGKTVKGEVRGFTNYGAFVDLSPGIEGFVHTADISWTKKPSHPSEILKKGASVEAVVMGLDHDARKVNLSIKQLSDNPWDKIETVLPVGSVVRGTVTKITAFGAFVELENGIEGLVHVSEISDQTFDKIEDIISKGQEVTAKVVKVEPEFKKVALSMKEVLLNNSQESSDEIVVGEKKKRAPRKKSKVKSEENE